MGIVSPAEEDAIVLEGHEAMVGDGDAMGVAGQVVENLFGTAEGWLGVDDSVLLAKLPEKVAPGYPLGARPMDGHAKITMSCNSRIEPSSSSLEATLSAAAATTRVLRFASNSAHSL